MHEGDSSAERENGPRRVTRYFTSETSPRNKPQTGNIWAALKKAGWFYDGYTWLDNPLLGGKDSPGGCWAASLASVH